MSYGLATICELCGEPMGEVYFVENILGTLDSVVRCTDKKCDYWECMPDENTMNWHLGLPEPTGYEKEEGDEE